MPRRSQRQRRRRRTNRNRGLERRTFQAPVAPQKSLRRVISLSTAAFVAFLFFAAALIAFLVLRGETEVDLLEFATELTQGGRASTGEAINIISGLLSLAIVLNSQTLNKFIDLMERLANLLSGQQLPRSQAREQVNKLTCMENVALVALCLGYMLICITIVFGNFREDTGATSLLFLLSL